MDERARGNHRGLIVIDLMGDDEEIIQTTNYDDEEAERSKPNPLLIPMPQLEIVPVAIVPYKKA